MPANINSKTQELSSEERQRLDALLASARKFHYLSFIFAGLSLLLSSLEKLDGFSFPLGDIKLPKVQTAVGIYIIVIILNLAADRLFLMAYPFFKLDTRKPPFAWIAIGLGKPSKNMVILWLILPILLCAISTAITLRGDLLGFSLSFSGVYIILIPRVLWDYLDLIKKREDERGGPATFSIYLLYHFRIIRKLILIWIFFIPVLAVVPRWRSGMLSIEKVAFFLILPFIVLRTIGWIPFVYKFIDKFGTKYGFPGKSEHY